MYRVDPGPRPPQGSTVTLGGCVLYKRLRSNRSHLGLKLHSHIANMKVLVALCAVVACCVAAPGGYAYSAVAPFSYAAAPAVYAGAPAVSYSAPAVSYAAPSVSYSAPAVSYAAPAVSYATPAISYATPAISYAAPATIPYASPAVAAPAVAYTTPVVKTVAATPVAYAAPAVAAAQVVAGVKTQYHAQDELGQASYGHSEPGQVHNAVQDAYGNKVGSFSYVNPEGNVLRTDYVADGAGYRVASNALPAAPIVQPIDTPEVAVAKANFYAQYHAEASKVRARRSVFVQTPASTQPLATAVVAPVPAPVAYSGPVASSAFSPIAYGAPAAKVVSYAAGVPAPVSYASVVRSPVPYAAAVSAPVPYAAAVPAPIPYAAAVPAPVPYAAAYAAPVAYSAHAVVPAAAPALRPATLTTVVNNPGHAVSYRVD